jgi:hypothetical protein
MKAPESRKAAADEVPRRKQLRIRQEKIDKAQAILGTRTASETIERALDMIVFQQEMLDGLDGMYGAGVANVFDEEAGSTR